MNETKTIHQQAVESLGKMERLEHLRKEAIELAHEIDKYLDGKSDAERVVSEAHDVAYVARSLEYIEGFTDFYAQTHTHYLDLRSEAKLMDAIKLADKGPQRLDFADLWSSKRMYDFL